MARLFRSWPLLALLAIAGIQQHTTTLQAQNTNHIYDLTERMPTAAIASDPGDPSHHRQIELPMAVQSAFYELTVKEFEENNYEEYGPTKLSSLFGGVSQLKIPGWHEISLYVYRLFPNPIIRRPHFVLLLHEMKTGRVTSQPPRVIGGNFPEYSPHLIRFQDIYGDDRNEIVVMTGEHHGTDFNLIKLHGFSIEEDLSLHRRLELETGQTSRVHGKMFQQVHGYVIRSIAKLGPEQILVTTSVSKTKLEPGAHIKRVEMYEIDEDGRYEPLTRARQGQSRYSELNTTVKGPGMGLSRNTMIALTPDEAHNDADHRAEN